MAQEVKALSSKPSLEFEYQKPGLKLTVSKANNHYLNLTLSAPTCITSSQWVAGLFRWFALLSRHLCQKLKSLQA